MNNKSKANKFQVLMVIVLLAMTLIQASPAAAQSDVPTQESCHTLAEKYGNVAQAADPEWQQCFLNGWVNWVFDEDKPLPEDSPEWLTDAMQKGGYVQITEMWNRGCNDTLVSPKCSIGFLKLFPEWKSLKSFLEFGEFMQAGVEKSGPWSRGSIWFTNSFVMVSEGKSLTASQTKAFCEDQVAIAFALDGEYPLPPKPDCDPDTKFYLREKWNGSCIGNELPDAACNVGEVLVFDSWTELNAGLNSSGFHRGSVFANSDKLQQMEAINVDPDNIQTYSPFKAWVIDQWLFAGLVLLLITVALAVLLPDLFKLVALIPAAFLIWLLIVVLF